MRACRIAVLACAVGLAACGSAAAAPNDAGRLPRPGRRPTSSALDAAPGRGAGRRRHADQRMPGPRTRSAGDLADVGEALVEAATELNAEARKEPGGQANIELGYLLGAVEAGAARTDGIHSDLVRRLDVAAHFSPGRRAAPAGRSASALATGVDGQGSRHRLKPAPDTLDTLRDTAYRDRRKARLD